MADDKTSEPPHHPTAKFHLEPLKETLEKHRVELDALRKSIEEGLKEDDDVILYRFLRGYSLDVAAASAALNKSLKWRKENKVDEIAAKVAKMEIHEFPYHEKMSRLNPQNVHHGFDKYGQPLALAQLGRLDPNLLIKILSDDAIREYMIYFMEYKRNVLSALSREKGVIFRTCRIVDLTGLGSKHLAPKGLKAFRSVISLVQDNYPEMAGTVYYVNAPWIFTSLWTLIKPWIKPTTLEKVAILGHDYQAELLKAVDAKYLPKNLGGECTCSDKGGCIPNVDVDEGMTKLVVGASASQQHVVVVPPLAYTDVKEAAGASYLVTWEFRTESNNIDFEVKFQKASDKSEEVIAKKARLDSHLQMIEGGYETKEPGSLIFTWDNTYSWTSSKTVLYRVEVMPKDTEVAAAVSKKDEEVVASSSTSA